MVGNEGDKNLVDCVEFLASRVWADEAGSNRLGAVLIADQRIFAARDVQKADARPGGYTVTGGHGGLLGAVGHEGPPVVTYVPARRHTHLSEVNLSRLPGEVRGVRIKSAGLLFESAIPKVTIVKEANYSEERASAGFNDDVDLVALVNRNQRHYPLAGFVVEGHSPYGTLVSRSRTRLLKSAVYRGMPVVAVGRGNNEGFSAPHEPFIGGRNLTATKARLLLMACLLRFGPPSPAADADSPSEAEKAAVKGLLAEYQKVFDSH